MRNILIFDDIQREDAEEQAKAMRGSDEPLSECIRLGRDWANFGLAFARRDYEALRAFRELRKEGAGPVEVEQVESGGSKKLLETGEPK